MSNELKSLFDRIFPYLNPDHLAPGFVMLSLEFRDKTKDTTSIRFSYKTTRGKSPTLTATGISTTAAHIIEVELNAQDLPMRIKGFDSPNSTIVVREALTPAFTEYLRLLRIDKINTLLSDDNG